MKKYNLILVLLSASLLLSSGALFPREAYAETQVLSDASSEDTREEKISLICSMLTQAISIAGDSGTSGSDSASEGLLLSTLEDAYSDYADNRIPQSCDLCRMISAARKTLT